jgi:hypothetical protein
LRALPRAKLADDSISDPWKEAAPAKKSVASEDPVPIAPGSVSKQATLPSRLSPSAKRADDKWDDDAEPAKPSVSLKAPKDDGAAPRRKQATASSKQPLSTKLDDDSIFDVWEEVAPRRPDSAAKPKSRVDDDAPKTASGAQRKSGGQWKAEVPRRPPVDDRSSLTTPRRADGRLRKDEEGASRSEPARPNGGERWEAGDWEEGDGWF